MFGLSLSITGRKSTFSVIWSRLHFSNCELRPVKHLLVPIIQDNLNFSSCLVLLSHHGSLQLTPPPFRKRLCIDIGACAWTSYVTGNIYPGLYLPHSWCLHIPNKNNGQPHFWQLPLTGEWTIQLLHAIAPPWNKDSSRKGTVIYDEYLGFSSERKMALQGSDLLNCLQTTLGQ